jgi:hypothetical protein
MTQTAIDERLRHHSSGLDSRDDAQAAKRMANDYVRRGLRRLDPNESIPFLCECDEPDCFEAVWMKGVVFDRIRGRGGRVWGDGHQSATPMLAVRLGLDRASSPQAFDQAARVSIQLHGGHQNLAGDDECT